MTLLLVRYSIFHRYRMIHLSPPDFPFLFFLNRIDCAFLFWKQNAFLWSQISLWASFQKYDKPQVIFLLSKWFKTNSEIISFHSYFSHLFLTHVLSTEFLSHIINTFLSSPLCFFNKIPLWTFDTKRKFYFSSNILQFWERAAENEDANIPTKGFTLFHWSIGGSNAPTNAQKKKKVSTFKMKAALGMFYEGENALHKYCQRWWKRHYSCKYLVIN